MKLILVLLLAIIIISYTAFVNDESPEIAETHNHTNTSNYTSPSPEFDLEGGTGPLAGRGGWNGAPIFYIHPQPDWPPQVPGKGQVQLMPGNKLYREVETPGATDAKISLMNNWRFRTEIDKDNHCETVKAGIRKEGEIVETFLLNNTEEYRDYTIEDFTDGPETVRMGVENLGAVNCLSPPALTVDSFYLETAR